MNQKFIKFQNNLHGKEKAEKWLNDIPLIVDQLKVKWGLEIGKEFDLSFNYVVSSIRKNGTPAVLKIYFPGDVEFLNQLNALKIFNGDGAIKVLESDEKHFAILMEQCVPGDTLSSLNDEEKETLIFAQTAKKLWKKPGDYKFANVVYDLKDFDWYFRNLNNFKKPLPQDLVLKAQERFKYLAETQKDLYLLHSDLHHDNLLLSDRGWLAIDPKGVLGEREYEVTAFIRNPIKRAKKNLITKDILLKRLDILESALNLNRERMIDWAFAQTVLSTIWSLQSNSGRGEYWLKIARELEKL